jgi:hypothetical protein
MTSTSPLVRFCALVAPACLLVYSVLRWIDGLDGHHDHGSLFWNVGHGFFFVALAVNMELLPLASVLVGVGLAPLVRMEPAPARPAAPANRS